MKKNTGLQLFTSLIFLILLIPLLSFGNFFGGFGAQKVVVFKVLVGALFPIYLFLLIKNKDLRPNLLKPGIATLIIFFLWILFSSLFGVDLWNSIFGNSLRYGGLIFQAHLLMYSLYLILAFKIDSDFFYKLAKAAVVVASSVSIYGLLEKFGIIDVFGHVYAPRVSSTFGNPIFFASYLVIPFFFSILFLFKQKNKWPFAVTTLFILIGLYLAGTRGAFLGMALGLFAGVVMFAGSKINKKTKKIIASSLTIVALLLVLFSITINLGGQTLLERVVKTVDSSTSDRLIYWKIATTFINDSPVLGVGFENYYHLAEKYYTIDLLEGEGVFVDKPHSQFLETLSTSGIPGGLLYIIVFLLLIKILVNATAQKRLSTAEAAILLAGLVAYHTQNAFIFDTPSAAMIYVFLLSYILSKEQGVLPEKFKLNNNFDWRVTGAAIVVPAVLIFVLHYPALKQFHTIEKSRTASTPQSSIQQMQKLESNNFIFDHAQIGREYSEIMIRSIGARIQNDQLYDELSEKAEDAYNKSIARHPKRGEYHLHLGEVYVMHAVATGGKITDKQIEPINKARELMPERIDPKLSIVDIVEINEGLDKAIEMTIELHKLTTSNRWVSWTLAVLYLKNNQTDVGAPYALEAVKDSAHPNSSIELMRFFNYYVDKNEIKNAIRFVVRAIEVEPTNHDLLPQLAAAYAANGQTEKAIETAEKYIEKNPSEKESGKAFINQLLNK